MPKHQMVSVRLKKKKNTHNAHEVGHEEPKFPFGLRIHLEEETIEKLGMKDLPEVGGEMMLNAKVTVDSVSSHETEEDGETRSISLQITEMELISPSSRKSDAETFFPEE